MTTRLQSSPVHIFIQIPQDYYEEPIISTLIQKYHISVNIEGASLGSRGKGDGWFKLELQGTEENINSALFYLNDLNIKVWTRNQDEEDGW